MRLMLPRHGRRRPAIHFVAASTKKRRGWPAVADHDDGEATVAPRGALISQRILNGQVLGSKSRLLRALCASAVNFLPAPRQSPQAVHVCLRRWPQRSFQRHHQPTTKPVVVHPRHFRHLPPVPATRRGRERSRSAAEGATGPRKRSGNRDRAGIRDLWKAGRLPIRPPHRRSKKRPGQHHPGALNLSGRPTEGGHRNRHIAGL